MSPDRSISEHSERRSDSAEDRKAPDRKDKQGEADRTDPGSDENGRRPSGGDRPGNRGDQDRGEQKEDRQKDRKPGQPDNPPWYHRPWIVGGIILAAIVLTVGGVLLYLYTRTYEYTDDAYVDIQSEQVSARVSGRVVGVLVNDNQDVHAGDLLVQLDPADFQTALDRALAASQEAQTKRAQAEAQVLVNMAQLEQARASVDVAAANAANADRELQRVEQTRKVDPGAISQQQFDNDLTAAQTTAAQLAFARKSVAAAEAQTALARSSVQSAQAAEKSADADVEQAKLNLSYTQVRARLDGRIAQKTVAAGNYVQAGVDLMAVVPRNVYVTANFKETQLDRMRAGQRARIVVDAYPKLKLQGHVDSVQPGTGQAFMILPAQNATGNWVKIVQRVPVKILFDRLPDDPQRLAPGMSVEVKISLR